MTKFSLHSLHKIPFVLLKFINRDRKYVICPALKTTKDQGATIIDKKAVSVDSSKCLEFIMEKQV